MALVIATSGTSDYKFSIGNKYDCYGSISWSNTLDAYATGGFSVTAEIKRLFGVNRVERISFGNGLSDAGIATAEATARFDATTGKVKLYKIGRTAGTPGSANDSEVEIANSSSVDDGTLTFVATCDMTSGI